MGQDEVECLDCQGCFIRIVAGDMPRKCDGSVHDQTISFCRFPFRPSRIHSSMVSLKRPDICRIAEPFNDILRNGLQPVGQLVHSISAMSGKNFLLAFAVSLNPAGENVVVPSVNRETSVGDSLGDSGLSAEVGQLGDNVAADDRGQFGLISLFRTERLAMAEGAFDVFEPAAGLGQVDEIGPIEGSLEGPAIRVTAKNSVLDLENLNRVLDSCG